MTADREQTRRDAPRLDTSVFPPVPQGVFGVCEGCGAVAWELLNDISPLCMGCAPWDYNRDDEDDDPGDDSWDDR